MTLSDPGSPSLAPELQAHQQSTLLRRNPMLKKLSIAAAAALAVAAAGTASAHTISIGVYNAGAPGSVTLAMGTYDHGPGFAQGAMALIAGPTIVAPVAFSNFTTVKPSALVDGTNNFYANATSSQWGTLPSDSYTSATNVSGLGPVVNWQEVTFTGLVAGTYTYQLSGMTSANWNNINSFEDNWTGTIVISGTTAGVPEPGTLALAGLALAGVAAVARRRSA
jgi:PEP-CTERM motif